MTRSLLSELKDQLAHPKPSRRKERGLKVLARAQARLQFRDQVMRADRNTCQWCGKCGLNLHAAHVENKRAHARSLDAVDNGIALCFICHYWFDEGGKVNGHVRTANQFRIMVFEKHEHEPGFRFAGALKQLREQEEYKCKHSI